MIPTLLIIYFFIWRPQIIGVAWSFFNMKGYNKAEFIGLKNYARVLSDPDFVRMIWNSVQYVLWSIVIGFVPPVILAVFINELRRGKGFFRVALYLPGIVPGIVAMLLWKMIYVPDQYGLLNMALTKLGIPAQQFLNSPHLVIPCIILMLTWNGFGGSVLYFYTALQSTSTELYEAAIIDGAGMRARLWHVTIPHISGVILLNLVQQIINIFQISDVVMTMTGGGPNNASLSVGYQIYKLGFFQNRVGESLALGTVTFILLMAATMFYFKLNRRIEENY